MRVYGIDYKGITIKYLAARDNNKCALCGNTLGGNVDIDHIVPVKIGGTNEESNLRAVHAACHKARHARSRNKDKFRGRRGDKITNARRLIVQEIAPKIIEEKAKGKRIASIAREWNISRPTLYEYIRRYEMMKAQGLSRQPSGIGI